jgi:hypothetical protein
MAVCIILNLAGMFNENRTFFVKFNHGLTQIFTDLLAAEDKEEQKRHKMGKK